VPIEQEIESPRSLTLHSNGYFYTFNGMSATDLLVKKEKVAVSETLDNSILTIPTTLTNAIVQSKLM
jgi:hypothetical protein